MDAHKPHINDLGVLVIPFATADNEDKYWKQEGRSLAETLRLAGADEALFAKYTTEPFAPEPEPGPEPDPEAD